MALQHRILHNILVDNGYMEPIEDPDELINTVSSVTHRHNLYGYFMYHYGLSNAAVDMMYGSPGAIPDQLIVKYGIENEDHEELAKYIDDITPFIEGDPAPEKVDVADAPAAVDDEIAALFNELESED